MFGSTCSIIGAVHVPALPGSANFSGNMEELLGDTIFDALSYKECGVDAIIVENMHDAPYFKGFVEPEAIAAMTILANAVKYETMLPIGVQLLAGANLESLAVALACGLDFIRVEGFVYAHVGDEGIHESCAAELIRRRAYLKADKVKIFADIKKKHSAHSITNDVSLVETAEAAQFFQADAVIVSGRSTGHPPDLESLRAVKEGVDIPVLVGSGANEKNAREFAEVADAIIVGSDMKIDGRWQNAVDPSRVERFMAQVKTVR